MFIIGVALGAILFSKCNGSQKGDGSNELGKELNTQYQVLKTSYDNLLKNSSKIELELKQAQAELTAVKFEQQKQFINYGKAYIKGRNVIVNNPCKDSLHLAAYDSLNASCERVQADNNNVVKKLEVVVEVMQKKVNNRDSVIDNRNSVIGLDSIKLAAYKDSLSSSHKINRKKVVKAFFVGVAVGAAAREAVGVAVKVLDKK